MINEFLSLDPIRANSPEAQILAPIAAAIDIPAIHQRAALRQRTAFPPMT